MEREDENHPSKRPRVAERVPIHVLSEVAPQNRDFDVDEFLRSSPNPVVASLLEDSEIIQKATVRRGYPVDSTNAIPTFDFGISEPRLVAHPQLSSSERAD